MLNKVAEPQDGRFSKHVLVVAPGLTVRNRLKVLEPAAEDNFYDKFDVVPAALRDRLRQGRVLIRNWHALAWENAERLAKKRSVDKRGPRSDEAYVRGVLEDLASARNLLVINDEAHGSTPSTHTAASAGGSLMSPSALPTSRRSSHATAAPSWQWERRGIVRGSGVSRVRS